MSNPYILPDDVSSPKRYWTLVAILFDAGEEEEAISIGMWNGAKVLAIRWNGSKGNRIGNPQSRGLPTRFIVPQRFRPALLAKVLKLKPVNRPLVESFFGEKFPA